MGFRLRWIVVLAAFLSLAWAMPAQAFTLIEDHFDVTVSTNPSANPPISDVHFFRAFTDANATPQGQLTALSDISRGANGQLIGLLLPAVQKTANTHEAYSLIGFCDGSVLIAMGDGSVRLGDSTFDFQKTFGMPEADVITALQGGNDNAIIAVLLNAYNGGLLPAVQTGPSDGLLVNFSAPTQVGTISVVENAPEPASLAIFATLLLPLASRRRYRP